MILDNSEELLPDHLPYEIVGRGEQRQEQLFDPWEQWLRSHPQGPVSLDTINERIERYFVRWALDAAHHNRTKAAELLGFSKVDQLRYLMRKHGID